MHSLKKKNRGAHSARDQIKRIFSGSARIAQSSHRPVSPPAPSLTSLSTRPHSALQQDHSQPKQGKPLQRPATDGIEALWESAIRSLPVAAQELFKDEIAELTTFDSATGGPDILKQLLKTTHQKRQECEAERWKFQVGNKQIVLRDVIEKIIDFANKFNKIGDAVIPYDPGYATLPWAGFVLILQFTIAEAKVWGCILTGLQEIAKFVTDCAFYERLYLSEQITEISDSRIGRLRESLITLYRSILSYLLKTLHICRQNSLVQAAKGARNIEDLQGLLEQAKKDEGELKNEVWLIGLEVNKISNEANIKRFKDLESHLKDIVDQRYLRFDAKMNSMVRNLGSQHRSDVLQWLSKVSYPNHHEYARGGRVKGTGEWLLRHESFIHWQESSASSLLWLKGNAGTGKTKLASFAIDALKSERDQSPGNSEALAYFYCNRDDPQRRKPEVILSTLIKQLASLRSTDPLQEVIVAEYEARKQETGNATSLNYKHSCKLAQKVLNIYPQSLIVVDAVDECEPDVLWDFLKKLCELATESERLVKVFITSRPDEGISDLLTAKSVPTIVLESGNQQMASDIRLIVESKANQVIEQRNSLFQRLEPEEEAKLKAEMIQILVDRAEGMPLWIVHQINNLCQNRRSIRRPEDVLKALKEFPPGLTATYEYILRDLLNRPEDHSNALGISAFKWVMTAIRPLNPDELVGALWISKEGAHPDLQDILVFCYDLLVHDEKENVMRFHHVSVREYLEDHWKNLFTKDVVQARSGIIERPLLKFCEIESWSAVQNCFCFSSTGYNQTPQQKAFFLYVAFSWPAYFSKVSESESLLLFLRDHPKAYRTWISWLSWAQMRLNVHNRSGKNGPKSIWDRLFLMHPIVYPVIARAKEKWKKSPLLVCAHWGFSKAAELLLDQGTDLMLPDALVCAAQNGHWEVVRLLVENSTRVPNTSLWSFRTTLERVLAKAAHDGSEVTVRCLVENGFDTTSSEALRRAATSGHKEIVKLLVENGADATSLDALTGAMGGGDEEIVMFFNENGADVTNSRVFVEAAGGGHEKILRLFVDNGSDATNPEALIRAALNGHKEIVKFLIEKGVDATNSQAFTKAAEGGHEEIVRLLIENGADATNPKALIKAVDAGHREILRLLVKNGADATNLEALELAAEDGHEQVLKFLVESGADATNPNALVRAAEGGHEEIVRFLVENGADATNQEALACAAYVGSGRILRFLLEHGADTSNPQPLASAAQRGHEDIVKFLVKKGADVTNPETLRQAAARGPKGKLNEIVKFLIEKGANAANPEALEEAAEIGHEETLRFLVENGADATNLKPLILAAKNGFKEIVMFLVEHGADATNPEAFQLAANNGHEEIVKFLVENGADVMNPVALEGAAELGHGEVVKFLIEKGANAKSPKALTNAAHRGHEEIVVFLTHKGANTKSPEPLVLAAEKGHEEIVKFLVEKGADAMNPQALETAALVGNEEIVKFLVERGCNATNSKALRKAAGQGNIEIVKFLVGKGADATDPELLVAAVSGIERNAEEMVFFLIENGADATNPKALEWAADLGREGVARLLVEHGADATNPEALEYAAGKGHMGRRKMLSKGHREIIRFLIEKGGDITNPQLLTWAANQWNSDGIVRFLIESGADATNPEALLNAVRTEDEETVKLLVENGVEATNPEALKIAATQGDRQIVMLLIKKGADATAPEVLLKAVYAGHEEIVKLLVENGADAMSPEALEIAVMQGHRQIVMFLIKKGADATTPEALLKAVSAEQEEIVKLLVRNGADAANPEALEKAVMLGHRQIVMFLIKMGADATNPEALKLAVSRGYGRIVKLLVENGADATNPEVIEKAVMKGYRKIVMFLIKNGADVKNPEALKLAESKGHREIVKLLIENCADPKHPKDSHEVLPSKCERDDADAIWLVT